MKRKRKLKQFLMPEITLTPLIDTALTLLVIFMVAAPMLQHSIKVNLPKGKSIDIKEQPKQIAVNVLTNGVISINDKSIERSQVINEIKALLNAEPNSKVYVYGDSSASYGVIVELFDDLKNASISSVVLALKPKQG